MLTLNFARGAKTLRTFEKRVPGLLISPPKPLTMLYNKPKADKQKFTVIPGDFRETRTPFICNVCSGQLLHTFAGIAVSSLQMLEFLFSL